MLSINKLPNRAPHTVLSIKRSLCVFLRDCIFTGLAVLALSTSALAGTVEREVPDAIDRNARYLFYMHGFAIEQGGARARDYDYFGILKELAKRGFVVIGEERSRVRNSEYAGKVAGQVRTLLAAGVPAGSLTVAGHSKGGMITMLVMAMLANPEISYVNFAGCGRKGSGFEGYLQFAQHRASMSRGKLLSAYDRSDKVAGSCKAALDEMSQAVVTERVLDIGGATSCFTNPRQNGLISCKHGQRDGSHSA